jgi:hypothetical protein
VTSEQVAHRRAQLLRFARMTGYALAVQLLAFGGNWPGWAAVWSLLPAAAETALRQALPVKPLPTTGSVLAPTVPPPGFPATRTGTVPMPQVPPVDSAHG